MTSRPILFSAPMVRALLAGTKTQTRRTLRNQDILIDGGGTPFTQRWDQGEQLNFRTDVRCPYGAPGDKLWVRETWAPADGRYSLVPVVYRADGDDQPTKDGKWKPSIFMPSWASRITLTVTDVRVQRVQDISEEDAKAEGVEGKHSDFHPAIQSDITNPNRRAYAKLWDSINGSSAPWASNPWVWAISFRRIA